MYGWVIVCPCPIGRGRSGYAESRWFAGTKRWRGTRRSAVKTRSSSMPRASIWLRTISSRASRQAASARGSSVGAGAAAQVRARAPPAIANAIRSTTTLWSGPFALTRRAADSHFRSPTGAATIPRPMTRFIALLLTALTGFSGLVYEVVWQKYLATLLGSHSEATAAVLAIFLRGLALRYAPFGRATRRLVARARVRGRPAPLALFYACAEGSIGL